MTRKLSAVLIIVLLSLSTSGAWALYYDEGQAGTEADPYIIDSLEDITALSDRVNSGTEDGGSYYKLTSNISISGTASWNPIGAEPNTFTGHFDGSGYTITMNISNPAYRASVFGRVDTASSYAVRNLHVTGTIRGKFVASIASMVGEGTNASIEGCSFEGTLGAEYQLNATDSIYDNHTSAGGIVETMQSGTIRNCEVNDASITANMNNDGVSAYAGGIAATMGGGVIESCSVNDSRIDTGGNDSYSGGIVGDSNYGAIRSCNFSGVVHSDGYSGGIVGRMRNGESIANKVDVNNNTITSSDVEGNAASGAIVGSVTSDAAGSVTGNNASDVNVNGNAASSSDVVGEYANGITVNVNVTVENNQVNNNNQENTNNNTQNQQGGSQTQTDNTENHLGTRDGGDGSNGGSGGSGGGGGCSSGFGILALAALTLLRKK